MGTILNSEFKWTGDGERKDKLSDTRQVSRGWI